MDKCGEKCEVYSRVTGYFRPVSNWNKGKKEEFKDRKTFKVVSLLAALAALTLAGCSHNCVSYGDGIMLETTINPETYAFGVSLRYGKILTACVRENVELKMQGAGQGNAGTGTDSTTGASSTGTVTLKVGRQITGYYVDAVAAGAKAEDLDKYTAPATEK